MRYIVRFYDHPDTAALRRDMLAAHLAWLDAYQQRVLVAGSLWPEAEERADGGLWIVEAECEAEIRDWMQTDPFWICGLRAGVEIFRWRKAFPERNVAV